jgi:hypothetical protein
MMKRHDDKMTNLVATFEADAVNQTYATEYKTDQCSVQTLGQQLVDNGNQIFDVRLLDAFLVTAVLAVDVWDSFYRRKQ